LTGPFFQVFLQICISRGVHFSKHKYFVATG
jgi:hypothetical protein